MITNCIVADNVTIEDKCVLSDCIILEKSHLPAKTELTNSNFPEEDQDIFRD